MNENISQLQLDLVQKFQCPGCGAGIDVSSGCFKPSDTLACGNHSAGTYIAGIGCINLGLPKGFNRLGPINKDIQKSNIRLFAELPEYNAFNMPLWALEEDGHLFVVVAIPRLQQFWVDVVPGKKISDLPPNVIDVSTIDLSACR
mgnify:CR=1 FL=1